MIDVILVNYDKSARKHALKKTQTVSVSDLRLSFEKLAPVQMDAANADTGANGKDSNLSSVKNSDTKESTTLLEDNPTVNITSSELASISEVVQNDMSVQIVTLKPEIVGSSVGITLAGGADYETKEVTIHNIRNGSVAHLDGRLQKGDKIISINGRAIDGLTHSALVAALREHLPELTLAVVKYMTYVPTPCLTPLSPSSSSANELSIENKGSLGVVPDNGSIIVVSVKNDTSGVLFSLEGGKDSLQGDMPLLIKRVFQGAAEKCGNLHAGDQLLKINDMNVSAESRFKVWSEIKKLPKNEVILFTVKRQNIL